MSESDMLAPIRRTIEATPGKPADLRHALDVMAETSLGFLAAYQAWLAADDQGEFQNALLWAGALYAATSHAREASYRE